MSARYFARRCRACLALVALILQLVLSFAHVHRGDLPRIDRADVVGVARGQLQVAERLLAALADDEDHCPICFSGFLLSNSSLPVAPANSHSLLYAEIDRTFNPLSDPVLRPRHAAFLSRAPPVA
jgi:hypothetical protein